jgi:hypothetical protein
MQIKNRFDLGDAFYHSGETYSSLSLLSEIVD